MDFNIPANLLAFLQTQGYLVMLLIVILEGAIITYVAGFAASLGIFNVYVVFLLSVLGNFIGDVVYYLIGRFGKKTSIYRHFVNKIGPDKVNKIEHYLKNNLVKTLLVVKLTPVLPAPGLVLAGTTVPYRKFLFYTLMIGMMYSAFLTMFGFYSGVAFNVIVKSFKYVEISIGLIVILFVVVWIGLRRLFQKIEKI